MLDVNNNIGNVSGNSSNFSSRQNSIRSQRMTNEDSQVDGLEKRDLQRALSRKNSFISYFDNKLNIPDLTFDNLLVAVEYIVRKIRN